MNKKFPIRAAGISLSTFLISVVFLWPLRTISPIADDLHLISQGSGMMRLKGLRYVMEMWSDFSLSSAHITPLGGIWTSVYVWVTNQLAIRTPLTLDSAWGILRVLSIAFAIQSVLHLGRTIARRLLLPDAFIFLVLLVLLATIQVHGYWSNDPVVAFPVASWAFCILGFYFLSFLLRSTSSDVWPQKYNPYITVLLALLGILTYELFLAFLVAGFFFIIWNTIKTRKFRNIHFVLLVGSVLTPALFLIVSQLIRLSGGSSYTGTEIALQGNSLPKIFFVATLSSLPFTNFNLTQQLLSNGRVIASQFWVSVSILVTTAIVIGRRNQFSKGQLSRSYIFPILAGLLSLWLTATALISITPKYQSELNGVLGKVYINYAPSWLAISLLISIGIVYVMSRQNQILSTLVLLIIPMLGGMQVANNLRQVSTLTIDTAWSRPLFSDLETAIEQNSQRCTQVDLLFGMPLPEYYQNEVFEGMQDSYQGTNGVPYCDFENLGDRSPISVRNVSGLFRVEFQGDGQAFFWSNSDFVAYDVTYRGTETFNGQLQIQVDPTPCPSKFDLKIKIGNDAPRLRTISTEPVFESRSVSLSPGDVFKVEINQIGDSCTIATDPRSFMPMMRLPKLIDDQSSILR
jgi:hypothetical protein